MNAETATTLLTNSEFILWMAALAAAVHAKLHRRFSAVVCFLGVKFFLAVSYTILAVYFSTGSHASSKAYSLFFYIYWIGYFLGTLSVFLSIEQLIRQVLSPMPGLSKLGVMIFRFTGLLTLVIAFTSHLSEMGSLSFYVWLQAVCVSFALCMCVFEVTLMSLLISTGTRLGLSFGTRIFGLGLGFCMFGLVEFVTLIAQGSRASRWAGASMVNEVAVFLTLAVWSAYFLFPEQKRGPLRLKESSTLMKWNEIVSQLGVGAAPVVQAVPSFMSDVDAMVTRIMERRGGEPH